MDQLTQDLKKAHMQILEVPFPALNKGQVLVRNHYSVISAGSEGKTLSDARKGYIAKAKSRQKEVKQVIDMIKTRGLSETYKIVMNKLETPSALGYSSAGEVIGVGEGISEFKVGDRVAVEAMAAGLPIISTDQGAIVESVIHGENGFIVESHNPHQIAEKIKFLIKNPDAREKMGAESRKKYLENFTEGKMVERLHEVFEKVMNVR
jgi:glycosyltransferase involved in cell wall biosynthesis